MYLPPADQPLVCEDRDEDFKGHALVLLGRGSRSRRLPRDATVVLSSTSPRLQGEVEFSQSENSGEGYRSIDSPHRAERAPHPDPLPVRTGRGRSTATTS